MGTDMGSGRKYFVMLAFVAAIVPSSIAGAAEDWPDHDHRIEKWTAERLSGKLGSLRGGFDHRERVDAVIVRSVPEKPEPRKKPATRIFILPTTGETLPPIVENDRLPPGVDPIITGSNKHPTGNAGPGGYKRPAGDPRRYAARLPAPDRVFPARTSMLID